MEINVIGQDNLIKEVSKLVEIFLASECQIKPHFILTGPSGNGKTLTMQAIAEASGIGYLEINAAQLTKEGHSGNSLTKALVPLGNSLGKPVICFVDEFDKLFISGNSNTDVAHENTTGVQNEFLKVLEGNEATIFGDYGKYRTIPVDKVLFVFAGAFNNEQGITVDRLRDFGMKTEFLGRVGICFEAEKLSLDHLYEVLDTSPLLDQYLALFEDVDRETVVYEIKAHLGKIYEHNTLGARVVKTLLHQYFIKGGLPQAEVEKVTFSKKLSLK